MTPNISAPHGQETRKKASCLGPVRAHGQTGRGGRGWITKGGGRALRWTVSLRLPRSSDYNYYTPTNYSKVSSTWSSQSKKKKKLNFWTMNCFLQCLYIHIIYILYIYEIGKGHDKKLVGTWSWTPRVFMSRSIYNIDHVLLKKNHSSHHFTSPSTFDVFTCFLYNVQTKNIFFELEIHPHGTLHLRSN